MTERSDKVLVWLHGEVKTPPMGEQARRTTGFLLRMLQRGLPLSMPDSRPMPSIGSRCHELRIRDPEQAMTWRVIYRLDADAIIVGDVFPKKTQKTPIHVIDACQRRFQRYDDSIR